MQTKYSVMAGLTMVGLLGPAQCPAVSESYVDSVSAEVREFETGEFALPAGSPWLSPDRERRRGLDRISEGMHQFEAFFAREYRGTYIQYRTLPVWKQQQVYEEYRKTGDMERVRKLVLKTLGGS